MRNLKIIRKFENEFRRKVKLDGLGTFSPSVDGQKKGKNSLAKAVEAGADAMINGIKINFTPENTKGEKLTSRAFKDQCVFEFGYVVESEVRTVDGKDLFSASFCLKKVICLKMKHIQFSKRAFWDTSFRCGA